MCGGWGSEGGGGCGCRVLHYLNFAWHGHGNTHGIPWHPHGIPWCGIGLGFHGTPWGVSWHATGDTMVTPAATATALNGTPTECHGNPHGTQMFTAPRLRWLRLDLGLEEWRPRRRDPQHLRTEYEQHREGQEEQKVGDARYLWGGLVARLSDE